MIRSIIHKISKVNKIVRMIKIYEENMEIIKSIIHKVNKVSIFFTSSIVIEVFGIFFFFKKQPNTQKTTKTQ